MTNNEIRTYYAEIGPSIRKRLQVFEEMDAEYVRVFDLLESRLGRELYLELESEVSVLMSACEVAGFLFGFRAAQMFKEAPDEA